MVDSSRHVHVHVEEPCAVVVGAGPEPVVRILPRTVGIVHEESEALVAQVLLQVVEDRALTVDPLVSAWRVGRRGEFSPLGPLASCFLALGFGLGLDGTVSARR